MPLLPRLAAASTLLVVSIAARGFASPGDQPAEGPALPRVRVPKAPALPATKGCLPNAPGVRLDASLRAYDRRKIDAAAATHGWRRLPAPSINVGDDAAATEDDHPGQPPERYERAGKTYLLVGMFDPCDGPVPDRYFIDASGGVFAVRPTPSCAAHRTVEVCGSIPAWSACGARGSRGHLQAGYVAVPGNARFLGEEAPLAYAMATCVTTRGTEPAPKAP